jgi:tripeptide aminopeptidase
VIRERTIMPGQPPSDVRPNVDRAFELLMDLLAIPGRSGEEGRVVDMIRDRLVAAGADPSWIQADSAHRRTPLRGDTGNLIVRLPGTRRAPRRMLSAHMDTVPLCVGAKPRCKNGIVRSTDPKTALGADDRAGVAVLLSTVLDILEQELDHPPLTLCWFIQEETGLHGSRCVSKHLLGRPKMAFNWDGGSASKLTVGATGGYRMTIRVHGLASHAGGAPERGVSAITIAAVAIADLHRGGWLGDIRKGRLGGTSNVGVIRGGDATNVVTDFAEVRAEARSHDPAFRRRIVSQMEQAFERAASAIRNVAGAGGSVEIDGRLDYEAFRLSEDEPCVAAARAAVASIGRDAEFAIANGGLDANWIVRHGIPTVSLGCGQLNQHTVTEALDVAEFHAACRVALCLATSGETI